jgi:hypothetical protein
MPEFLSDIPAEVVGKSGPTYVALQSPYQDDLGPLASSIGYLFARRLD